MFYRVSSALDLYLFKSTIWLCMEYCFHVWACAPSCYLELLDKLQKRICRTVGLTLAASLEPLAHRQNVASYSIYYRCYFGSSLNLFHFLILEGGLLVILIDCMIFVTIPTCYDDVYVSSFLTSTARLWNSLPIEFFPLTYDLSGCKSRINRHFLTVGSS